MKNNKVQDYNKLRELLNKEIKKTKPKCFTEIKDKKFVGYQCPNCEECFGLDSKFIVEYGELIFRYTCPYCGKTLKIEER